MYLLPVNMPQTLSVNANSFHLYTYDDARRTPTAAASHEPASLLLAKQPQVHAHDFLQRCRLQRQERHSSLNKPADLDAVPVGVQLLADELGKSVLERRGGSTLIVHHQLLDTVHADI